ncbi:hypothetical protein PQQ84_33390 [Paraburkholderia strydomiana]|uniref:hypothetical protein n=1 Tax=Paraburkholderia strydomiana TaxID=1245417 RepID=UPI0038BAC62D
MRLPLTLTQASYFVEDVTARANAGGMDPRLSAIDGLRVTTDKSLPIMCQAQVNESFSDQFPEWRL